ncbi:MAG: 4-(cytidine 5'-diphospho)-2-C-methyl-D-erythritol kinase [Rhodobacteraceae bacterium]|nr:4-(cytidine 5'-diphospho)-2-C-methyl-D-erythritol kinase [Paracoccaceae bacterium]
MAIEEAAPAKVNLCLHVTGRRADGYHLLDSLVLFTQAGDRLRAVPAPTLTLEVTGPHAEGLSPGDDNLVLRAARLLATPSGRGARLSLEKRLPLASGIGGGSADAAAALRALSRMWRVPLPSDAAILALGADVPACLAGRPARMQGIGERLTPLPALPPLWLVLVNPRVEVPTGPVFSGLFRRDNAPLPPLPDGWPGAEALADWLGRTRNDLESPARGIAPVIDEVLAALSACPGGLLARMSGSGATCFALFAREAAARDAAARIARARPGWWVEATCPTDPPA